MEGHTEDDFAYGEELETQIDHNSTNEQPVGQQIEMIEMDKL